MRRRFDRNVDTAVCSPASGCGRKAGSSSSGRRPAARTARPRSCNRPGWRQCDAIANCYSARAEGSSTGTSSAQLLHNSRVGELLVVKVRPAASELLAEEEDLHVRKPVVYTRPVRAAGGGAITHIIIMVITALDVIMISPSASSQFVRAASWVLRAHDVRCTACSMLHLSVCVCVCCLLCA